MYHITFNVASCCLSLVEKKEKKPSKPRELLPFEEMEVRIF